MKLTVTNTSPLPLYRQMYDQLAAQILRGEIAPGEVLPPIRTVAQELSVSLISVRRAWEELERDGIHPHRRRARDVCRRARRDGQSGHAPAPF